MVDEWRSLYRQFDISCPRCDGRDYYEITTRRILKCHCGKQFNPLVCTPIKSTKLQPRIILRMLAFLRETPTASATDFSREFGINYKSASSIYRRLQMTLAAAARSVV